VKADARRAAPHAHVVVEAVGLLARDGRGEEQRGGEERAHAAFVKIALSLSLFFDPATALLMEQISYSE